MAKEELEIVIDGDAAGAKKAAKQANNAMGGLGNTLKKMAIAGGALFLAKKAFDAIGAAMKKVIDFTKESIKLAGEQERQEKKLAAALETAGIHTEGTAERLNEYAASLQKVTTYGDETIIGVEAMLATFGASEEVIKDATQVTLDMATAMEMDLKAAAILVGKAIAGETGSLTRYGIIVDEVDLKTRGFAAVMDAMNEKFAGAAQAQAETYTGRMEQLKNMWGDMKEEVGFALIPTLTKLSEWFMKGKEVIDPFTGAVTNLASPFEKLQGWIKEATDNMGHWLDLNWDNIIGIAEETFKKIENFITIIKEADYSEINKGLKDMGAAFGILIGDTSSGIMGADEKYQEFIDNVGESIQTLATAIVMMRGIASSIYFIVSTITSSIGIAIEFLGALGTWFISAGTEGEKQFKNLDFIISTFKDITIENFDSLKEVWGIVTEFIERETTSSTDKAEKEFNNMKNSVTSNFNGMRYSVEKAQKAINSMHGKNITSTHTINTVYKTTRLGYLGRKSEQAGGLISGDIFAPDLGIPLIKGEAVLPAPIVRAIKENRSSFAGINMDNSSSSNITNIHIHHEYNEALAAEHFVRLFAQEIGDINR